MYYYGIDDRTECLMKVDFRSLMKSFHNKASFIALNRAIRVSFDSKDPFIAHKVLMRLRQNENPGVVTEKGLVLSVHDMNPARCARDSRIVTDRLRN